MSVDIYNMEAFEKKMLKRSAERKEGAEETLSDSDKKSVVARIVKPLERINPSRQMLSDAAGREKYSGYRGGCYIA